MVIFCKYSVLFAFTALLAALAMHAIVLRRKTGEAFGKPSIAQIPFYGAKVSMSACFGFFIYNTLSWGWECNCCRNIHCISALVLLLPGTAICIAGMFNLGASLRVGLPREKTELKTGGIFSWSRNPIYLGLNLVCAAACLYNPGWFVIGFALLTIILHHFIILGEEKFLAERFKDDWQQYKSRVRRYF